MVLFCTYRETPAQKIDVFFFKLECEFCVLRICSWNLGYISLDLQEYWWHVPIAENSDSEGRFQKMQCIWFAQILCWPVSRAENMQIFSDSFEQQIPWTTG